MERAKAQQIEATMKQLIMERAPEEAQEFIDAISEDGVTQQEVDEFRTLTIQAIDNPRTYPRYMKYLESTGLMERADIPRVYDAGFLLSMLGMAGVAQDHVNG